MRELRNTTVMLLLAGSLYFIAGCQPTPAPVVAAPSESPGQTASDQLVQFTGIDLGKYVDPTTLAVVGISKEYAPTDHIFAAVKFTNATANVPVQVKVSDAEGAVIADKTIAIADSSLNHINFDFGIPSSTRLPPGHYTVDASIGGKLVATEEIEVK